VVRSVKAIASRSSDSIGPVTRAVWTGVMSSWPSLTRARPFCWRPIAAASGTSMTLEESSRLCTRSATRMFVLARMSSLTTPAGRWVARIMCTPRVRPTAPTLTRELRTSGYSLASMANSSTTSRSRGMGSVGLVAR